jgi:hypothetical protein
MKGAEIGLKAKNIIKKSESKKCNIEECKIKYCRRGN